MRTSTTMVIGALVSALLIGRTNAKSPSNLCASAESCKSLECFGGVGDGVTDNYDAFSAAIGSTTGQNCVRLQNGNYYISKPVSYSFANGSAAISIVGNGSDVSKMVFPSGANGLSINFQTQFNSVHLRDLSVVTQGAPTSGAIGIALNATAPQVPNPGNSALSDISGVTTRGADGYAVASGWGTHILLNGVSNVNLSGVMITGASSGPYATAGRGVQIKTYSPDVIPVVFNIDGSTINYVQTGIEIDSYVEGVTITRSNLIGDGICVYVPPKQVVLSELFITSANQLNCNVAAINTQSPIPGLQISNNLIINPSNSVGVEIGNAAFFSITNNHFESAGGSGQFAIIIEGYSSGVGLMAMNNFYADTIALWLRRGSTNVNVQSNAYGGGAVLNQGVRNFVGGGSP